MRSKIKNNKSVLPISVIIPCYRCSLTIKRSLDSIFEQSKIPFEVILVDDFSQDETLRVLQNLTLIFDRLRVVQLNINLGAGSARNAGWELATQPYIAFLDADDTWHPEKLRIQYEYMRANSYVALCGHKCIWLSGNEEYTKLESNLKPEYISAKSLLFKNAFNTPTVMLKRNIPFRFQEGKRFAEDLLLWQQIAFANLVIVHLDKPLAYVHKPLYGSSGLSAQLWRMEKGELTNIILLYQSGRINLLLCISSLVFSLIKYIRRIALTVIN